MWQDGVNKKPAALEMFPGKMEGYFFYPFVTPLRGRIQKKENAFPHSLFANTDIIDCFRGMQLEIISRESCTAES